MSDLEERYTLDDLRQLCIALAQEGSRKAQACRRAANVMSSGAQRDRMYGRAAGVEWMVDVLKKAAEHGD
jgi:hypothetical protein